MSGYMLLRCVICMWYYQKKDRVVNVHRSQAKLHIYRQHSYQEKIQAARRLGLIQEYEKQGADWLTEQLVEASDCSNSNFSLSQGVDQRIQ